MEIIIAGWSIPGYALGPVFVGSVADLKPTAEFAQWVTVDILVVYNDIFMVILILAAALYLLGGREPYLLWFCALVSCCLLRNLYLLHGDIPNSIELRNFLYAAVTLGVLRSTVGLLGTIESTVQRLHKRSANFLNWGYVLICLVLAGWFTVDHVSAWALVSRLLSVCALFTAAYLIYWIVRTAPGRTILENSVTLGLITASASLVLHDSGIILKPDSVLTYQLSNLAGLPMVMYFCAVLVSRYAAQRKQLLTHSQELANQLNQREDELHAAHAALLQAEQHRVVTEERERIMADMHDGVGGRLTTFLSQVKNGVVQPDNLALSIEQSLQDLRFIVDSLNPLLSENFSAALGTMRERLSPWLAQQDIRMQWHVQMPDLTLGPERTLHVYRFVQEALTNTVRHADATEVSITGYCRDDEICLEIADNGSGMPTELRQGYGLTNMHTRAQTLAGTLEPIDAAGVAWRLCFPAISQ